MLALWLELDELSKIQQNHHMNGWMAVRINDQMNVQMNVLKNNQLNVR